MNWLEKIGVELPIFQWTEPRAAAQLDWQSEGWPECKKWFALFFKLGFVVGLPVLVATRIWLPEGFIPAFFGLAGVCLSLPTLAALQMWINSKLEVVCVVRNQGLSKTYSSICAWKNIIFYRFEDDSDLPNVRVLCIKVHDRREQYERKFRFNPHEVSENQIREIIEAHLAQ